MGRQKGEDRVERPGWGVLVILTGMETSRGTWGAEVRWTGSWGYHLSSGRGPGEQVLTQHSGETLAQNTMQEVNYAQGQKVRHMLPFGGCRNKSQGVKVEGKSWLKDCSEPETPPGTAMPCPSVQPLP